MARFRGDVEKARRDLRESGHSAADARKMAPRVADMRQTAQDRARLPFSWAGGKSSDIGSFDDE